MATQSDDSHKAFYFSDDADVVAGIPLVPYSCYLKILTCSVSGYVERTRRNNIHAEPTGSEAEVLGNFYVYLARYICTRRRDGIVMKGKRGSRNS